MHISPTSPTRMGRARGRRLRVTGTVLTLVMLGSTLPATAAPLERENFVEQFEGEFDDCGFLVHFEHEARVNLLANPRGRDGLVHFAARVHGTTSWTNAEVEDSPVFSSEFSITERDARVIDNGDGTLTILAAVSGRSTYYLDGERLFQDSGLLRFEVLIDHGGTPTDPSDDEFIAELGLVKQAGRFQTDGRDFCEDLNEFLR